MLYNIVPPDSAYNNARIAFLKHFKWKRIATIRQNSYVFDEVKYRSNSDIIMVTFEWNKKVKNKLIHWYLRD